MLLICGSCGASLRAQTIRIKIVNGRNGHPMANRCVNVWIGNRSEPKSRPLLETQTDENGAISLRLTNEDTGIDDQKQRLVCGLSGVIDPVVKYGDTVGIRAGYVSCQPHTPDYSWLAIQDFWIKEVLQSGVVTANACGRVKEAPRPGELILFVRPLSWWEKWKQ
jgi:hypothetical protein